MANLLEGVRVIELAAVLAGPSVGQFFAECGAEVLKIEPPQGDVTRSWKLPTEDQQASVSAYFAAVNWGKQSIVLDLRKEEDRQTLYALVKTADIVLASYKKGDAERLGVDYATLQALRPSLIYGCITGYGTEDERVGYDAIIQAEAGFIHMNGEANGLPTKMPVALVDVLAAHQLKEGLLLALLRRERERVGSFVSVSLFDAAVASLANQATNWLVAGHIPQRIGSEHPNISPYGNIFETRDGEKILLAVGTDKQFAALCAVVGEEHLPKDARFATNFQRVRHRRALIPLLEQAIVRFDKENLLARLAQASVPAGGVNNMQQVFDLPEAQTLLLRAGEVRGVRNFVGKIAGIPRKELSAPPLLPT